MTTIESSAFRLDTDEEGRPRVVVNGHDLSGQCRSVVVKADAKGNMTAALELVLPKGTVVQLPAEVRIHVTEEL